MPHRRLLYFDVLCALFDASASAGNVCLYYKRYGSGDLLQIMPDAGDFRSFLFSIIQEVYDKQQQLYQSVRFLPSGVRGKACRD